MVNDISKENKMGTAPVSPLLIKMSIPMMISMLVQALYNIVDSQFVAQISEEALTAVSLAFPWQNLIIAVAVGTGVGVNSMLSRWLGANQQDLVKSCANHALLLAILSAVVFTILGVSISHFFFAAQTRVVEIINYGDEYLSIISLFCMGVFIACMCEKLLTATGRTGLTMITQIVGALVNLVLDPIMIFGYFGFPALGVSGAAIATVIGQWCGALCGLYLNWKHNADIKFSYRGFHWDWNVVRQIYSVGFPSIVMQAIGSVMTYTMNLILITFSTTATAVFGVYFKLQSFIFMPVFGLNNGLVPIAAFNYGASKPKRILGVYKSGIIIATLLMTLGFFAFQFWTPELLGMFNPSENMLAMGLPALRIISWSFLLAGFTVVTSAFFQALGHGMLSMWMSLIRQLVALIPLAWLFAQTGQLDLVWWSFPLAEIIVVVLSLFFLRHIIQTQIKPLEEKSIEV